MQCEHILQQLVTAGLHCVQVEAQYTDLLEGLMPLLSDKNGDSDISVQVCVIYTYIIYHMKFAELY